LEALHRHYHRLAQMAKRDGDLLCSHSVDEADARHKRKLEAAVVGEEEAG
jgi:hypothetical protein